MKSVQFLGISDFKLKTKSSGKYFTIDYSKGKTKKNGHTDKTTSNSSDCDSDCDCDCCDTNYFFIEKRKSNANR
jgi:hypothetical protein